ncbi:MAG: prolipoprotein diacylglyceryl transferase, partial [bacterium]
MHPEIFHIGNFSIRSYGVMLAIAFFIGIILAIKRGEKRGISPKFMNDLSFLIVIASIVGSRFFYVIFHMSEFRGHWLDIISPVQSDGSCGLAGLSMLGGVVLALFVGIGYTAYKKVNIYDVGDSVAPSLGLGLGLGRIGCFLNGCCFGLPAKSGPSVIFPPGSPAGDTFPATPLIPAQLYASALGFIIFIILLLIERILKPQKGVIFGVFLLLYGADRFWLDT